jgi:hypothetical protein
LYTFLFALLISFLLIHAKGTQKTTFLIDRKNDSCHFDQRIQ